MLYWFKKSLMLPVSAALCLTCTALGAAENGDELAEEAVVLEFRSVVRVGEESQYSLHDPNNGVSFWISDHEIRNGIEVVDFSPEDNTLTIYQGDEIYELVLKPSRVLEQTEPDPRGESGRTAREERRERYRTFRENWSQASGDSPELDETVRQLRSLVTDFRETRSARRQAERGTEERRVLREHERSVGEEIRLMSEYAALQASETESFRHSDLEVGQMTRMVRYSAFRNRLE